jgi:hypothetical protein
MKSRGPKNLSVNVGSANISSFWDLDAERELWADICRRNFWWFLQIAWGAHFYMESHPNEQWLTSRVHKPICDWFQTHVEQWEQNRAEGKKVRTKLAIIIPRSFGKTVTFTKAGSLWAHVRNPDLASYIGSEVLTKAIDFLRPIKTVMEGSDPHSWFAWLYGVWFSPERLWTHGAVVHGARRVTSRSEPSFGTWGVEGGITGAHPDWGILDDPLSEEKIKESGGWLSTVNQSVAALRPAFRTDSLFMFSLTRYRDNDVAGTYLKLEGVKSWHGHPPTNTDFTIREDGEWDVYFLQAYNADGSAVLPEVWPISELRPYEKHHPAVFAAQMMNEPGSGEHMELTVEQVAQLWVDEKDVPPNLKLTLHLDTAFKTNKTRGTGDESVYELWGHDPRGNGDVYYLEGDGSHDWRIEQFTDRIIILAQKLKQKGKRIYLMTDDKEMGGKAGTWIQWLKSQFHGAGLVMPPLLQLTRQGANKIVRMREAAGFWVDGHVRLIRGSPGSEKLVHQMVRLGISAHDDWADAAADVFAEEVYRPMLNPSKRTQDRGAIPRQPGDDLLGRWGNRADEARYWYDLTNSEWVKGVWERDDYQR